MNKIIYIIVLLGCTTSSLAQNFFGWSNNYFSITSYAGATSLDAFTLRIDGNGTLSLPTFRMSVEIRGPVMNGVGQTFPVEKLSLQPARTYGELNLHPVPTISEIGIPLKTVLSSVGESFIIPQSQAGIYNDAAGGNPYYTFFTVWNLAIEGGSYLGDLQPYSEFFIPLTFRFYDDKNKMKTFETYYKLQIGYLTGTPPEPSQNYSLIVDANAVNALLEFQTKNDYMNGVTATYPNGLKVNSSTDYVIKVKSLQPTFLSDNNNILPLNTVQVKLLPVSGQSAPINTVSLSTFSQQLASGKATQGTSVFYDIQYSIKPNDQQVIVAESDLYKAVLQYEITPK